MFALQVLSILVACTYMVAAVPTKTANISPRQLFKNKCQRGQFYYRNTCLPPGGPKEQSEIPIGITCPRGRYWHENGFCAPLSSIDGSKTTCPSPYKWNETQEYCERKKECADGYFVWHDKAGCFFEWNHPDDDDDECYARYKDKLRLRCVKSTITR
ncbi:hypothetical protein RSOL_401320 [Rhizoctonia solani AG-3 Rhs1AP]|uniref:Uncharacterized protein n=1 Tax=Rhizoctonia solani AG-3 Rhs1AP TaxID=1086054 RepID=X8JCZ5_9AGAM|nr:hypothetical protein RSOL_401320 [Rhizoctonia solani AG-3 Rhs1AP]